MLSLKQFRSCLLSLSPLCITAFLQNNKLRQLQQYNECFIALGLQHFKCLAYFYLPYIMAHVHTFSYTWVSESSIDICQNRYCKYQLRYWYHIGIGIALILILTSLHIHTHILMFVCICTCIHTHICTYIHTYIQTDRQTHIHTYIHTCMH